MADQIPVQDPTSQSNYLHIATTHLSLEWSLDFDTSTIHGAATHNLLAIADVSEVIFDTHALLIESVEVNGSTVKSKLDPEHPIMGSALHVPLPSTRKGDTVSVKIAYKTTADVPALLWLEKEQTEGKTFPYLFSQSQPIHARSIAPLQDTPSVKLTYDAKVTSVLPVLLSALRVSPPNEPPHGGKVIGRDAVTYEYNQPVPIPSYLLAIAAGNLRYKPFTVPSGRTWRSGVWTEPQLLDAAFNEFHEDTPRFLAAAEDLAGPYRFKVYDILILPYSFPYGGMENPCISFITPTLITGDRSLTDVVIHELTHSWFGNGVTNTHASHFWLNEGWTIYIERLLLQIIHASGRRGLSFVTGYKDLVDDLILYESTPRYQRLVIAFGVGEDPDAAYSNVPYDKGGNLLLLLEQTLGGVDVLRPYIKAYVNKFFGTSITTWEWKDHLYSYFADKQDKINALNTIDWSAWFFGEGITLPKKPQYDETLVTVAYNLADRWNASRDVEDPSSLDFKPSDLDKLDSNQRVVFLAQLETYEALPSSHLYYLDSLYKFSNTTNAEIRTAFYLVVLKDRASDAARQFSQPVLNWVVGKETGHIQGRMKFCRPLFRAVNRVDHEQTVDAYESARLLFHPIARKLIEQDLGIESSSSQRVASK